MLSKIWGIGLLPRPLVGELHRFLRFFGHACSCHNLEKRLRSATAPVADCVIISRFFAAGVKAWLFRWQAKVKLSAA
jgi:hypothetical protein